MGDLTWGWPRLEVLLLPVIVVLLYDIRRELKRLSDLINRENADAEG